MTLRKAILSLTLVLFFILMYTVLHTFFLISNLVDAAGSSLTELVGGSLNAFVVWAQFPLLFVVALLILYLTWGDTSLTQSK